jgi:hypothetical protein
MRLSPCSFLHPVVITMDDEINNTKPIKLFFITSLFADKAYVKYMPKHKMPVKPGI